MQNFPFSELSLKEGFLLQGFHIWATCTVTIQNTDWINSTAGAKPLRLIKYLNLVHLGLWFWLKGKVAPLLNLISFMPWRRMGELHQSWLDTRWRRVVSFTPWPLYYRKKSPGYVLDRSSLHAVENRELCCPCLGSNPGWAVAAALLKDCVVEAVGVLATQNT
jgi:hypothetical protein